jgi:hypothetical protein
MANDEEGWALRAELEARKEEIATLRGVVAALRGVAATRRVNEGQGEPRRAKIRILAATAVVGALVGFASALAMVEWMHG